jgi:hypothetical protein
MANHRDGGRVIIGVPEDDSGTPVPKGLSDEDLRTWTYDDLANSLAEYADPAINFHLQIVDYDGSKLVVIDVHEFDDIPVLCKKSYPDVLRAGACYVRTRRKPETVEIPTQADMRDILDLAVDKGVRRFVSRAHYAGLSQLAHSPPTHAALFDQQRRDFTTDATISTLSNEIRSRGYWEVAIRPAHFAAKRLPDISSLYPIVSKTFVTLRGWDFPHVEPSAKTRINIDWIGQEFVWEIHLSAWRFYQSGHFIFLGGMPVDWRENSSIWPASDDWEPGSLLGVGDAIFRFTEIFEFAARLAQSEAGDDPMHVDVTVGNLKDRCLYAERGTSWLPYPKHQTSMDEYRCSEELSQAELLATARQTALRAANELFKRFGWETTIADLQAWQEKIMR